MISEWKKSTLSQAGVQLIDCDHKTPQSQISGFPYIAIPNLKNGRVDVTEARRISKEDYVRWTRKAKPQPYDVILSRRCNPGVTAFVDPSLECAIGQNLVLLRADGNEVLPKFLRWLVQTPEWWEQISKYLNVGALFDSLKCADIPNFSLTIPSLEEQRAIAEILSALDDKIELNRCMNQNLEALTQAIFKQFFIINDEEKVEKIILSDLIKETIAGDWGSDAIDDICSEKVFCVRGADIYNINLGSFLGIPIRYLKKTSIEKRKIFSGDIVIELSGGSPSQSTGRSSVILDQVINSISYPIVCSNFCRVIRLKDEKHSIFVNMLLNYYYSRDEFFQYENGTTGIKNFAFNAFAAHCEIPKNFESKIEEFNTLVDPLYIKKYSNTMESDTLTKLRDTLLPKLMSGQIRLNLGKN